MPISQRTRREMGLLRDFQDQSGKFKSGSHWRRRKPCWDKDWLIEEYVNKQRSAEDIAREMGVGDTAIHFWLKKHGIKTRTVSEARAVKYWGASGDKNPMYGKRGSLSPNWRGGSTPERQAFYSSLEWGCVSRKARKRDNWTCQLCKLHKSYLTCRLELHHIEPFSVVEKRADLDNLVLLCEECHDFVHSKQNHCRRFLVGGGK